MGCVGPCGKLTYWSFILIPILELQHTPLPRNVVNQGAYTNSSSFHYFHLGLIVESIKELGGVLVCVICFVQTSINCFECLFRIINYYAITIFMDLSIYQMFTKFNYLCVTRMYVISLTCHITITR